MEKPTLNQLSSLIDLLSDIPAINNKYVLTGDNNYTDYLWDTILPSLSLKQYKFLLALIYNNEHGRLDEVMESMCFPKVNEYART